MPGSGEPLQAAMDGYAKFIQEKNLAFQKHQPYLVRWVRDFLLFAQRHSGYSFEQTLDMFLAEIGKRIGVKPWQIQQAADAVSIYRYQYRGASGDGEGCSPPGGPRDDGAMLSRLREVIRLRHYARSTEKTYLHWTRRFLEWTGGICPIARCAKKLLNGPRGGSMHGKCEVNRDTDCAWQLIYDRLLALGRTDILNTARAAKDWRTSTASGQRKARFEEGML